MDDRIGHFLDFLGNGVLVAHNALFDSRFLEMELRRAGEETLANPVLCTVRLARRLLPELPSKRLDAVAHHYGLQFRQRHRALGDAEVTARVLVALLRAAGHAGP